MTRIDAIRERYDQERVDFVALHEEDIPYLLSIANAARNHFEAISGTMAAQSPTGRRLGEMLGESGE